ncbi:MAG: hypothetical protein DMD79_07940 [Candidatus Rokuibacteriota bacterium]|nr:MAG: hypothetical protein DMD79_07940 [Candidatus Rokubacteria bacterium]
MRRGGRALDGLGVLPDYRSQPNCECRAFKRGSQTAGDKLRRREGNNPDRQLRSLSPGLVGKDVGSPRQPGGWLRGSHPLKSA